jgi:hypothetical protein
MRHTNKDLLVKGIKTLVYTALLMFTAPVVLYQAYKNTEHQWFIPVLIIGIVLSILAVALGFSGIKKIVDAVFGKREKK